MVRKKITLDERAVNRKIEEKKPAPEQPMRDGEAIKRLTLDMPESLHRALKMRAMDEHTTMAKMIRIWLEEKTNG
ncbi:MAG: hypothetical protein RPU61_04010 [Candidatus Sedimenticola sp. (ex Thyasira tokunagai)]